jgi:hypothetical protein
VATRPTFLQLPPELGGLRFGPFPGPVQIGSDNRRCQIVLDPSHGVFPVHAIVAPVGNQRYSVSAVAPEGKVFLIPYGQVHVWPVNGAVEAKVGDLVVLGTPHGPRFQIQDAAPLGPAPTAGQIVQNARATGGEAGLVQGVQQFIGEVFHPAAKGIGAEAKRQGESALIAGSSPYRSAYQLWHRVRTGVLENPYVLVALLFGVLGIIGTGSVSCTGLFWVIADVLGFSPY